MTVAVPPGRFLLKKDISITSSNVVLKGAGVSKKQDPFAAPTLPARWGAWYTGGHTRRAGLQPPH